MSPEFRLKKKNSTRSYFLEERKQKELISKEPENGCKTLN